MEFKPLSSTQQFVVRGQSRPGTWTYSSNYTWPFQRELPIEGFDAIYPPEWNGGVKQDSNYTVRIKVQRAPNGFNVFIDKSPQSFFVADFVRTAGDLTSVSNAFVIRAVGWRRQITKFWASGFEGVPPSGGSTPEPGTTTPPATTKPATTTTTPATTTLESSTTTPESSTTTPEPEATTTKPATTKPATTPATTTTDTGTTTADTGTTTADTGTTTADTKPATTPATTKAATTTTSIAGGLETTTYYTTDLTTTDGLGVVPFPPIIPVAVGGTFAPIVLGAIGGGLLAALAAAAAYYALGASEESEADEELDDNDGDGDDYLGSVPSLGPSMEADMESFNAENYVDVDPDNSFWRATTLDAYA